MLEDDDGRQAWGRERIGTLLRGIPLGSIQTSATQALASAGEVFVSGAVEAAGSSRRGMAPVVWS